MHSDAFKRPAFSFAVFRLKQLSTTIKTFGTGV